jgi:CMP-N-acetylneuraminic acid synthetase/mannose-6-phosphate isomerase-like protein (cupin superfamily)
MKIVGMIPARLGSKRIIKKNLRLLGDKPLIAYIIEAAKESEIFDEIYLNSEADIFGEIAKEYGISFYKRSETLASDTSINDEFLGDFVKNTECDICVQLLPTSPLITPEQISNFVNEMVKSHSDTLVSVTRHQIAAIYKDQPINFLTTEPHRSSQTMTPVFSYATVLMAWRKKNLLESLEAGYGYHGGKGKTGYFEIGGLAGIDIDNEEDFQLAEFIIQNQLSGRINLRRYYDEQKKERSEADVPSILLKDGVMRSDFDHENLPISQLDEIIDKEDSSTSWCRRIINTESNSATLISQLPGEGNRLHYHPDWNEWWYILRGQWKWDIDGKEFIIKKGEMVFIPKNVWHKITAIGNEPAVRLAVSRGDVAHVYKVD